MWVVIRLCTDEDSVTEYYNELDSQVELNFDILDDFKGEAAEVYEHNPWLTYGLPLHRMREWGFADKILDLLDERPFSVGECRQLVAFILGTEVWDVPDPAIDLNEFLTWVDAKQGDVRPTYNVIKNQVLPWFDVRKMGKTYGAGGCVVS